MLSCRHQTLHVEAAGSFALSKYSRAIRSKSYFERVTFINCSGSLRNIGGINSTDDPPTHETLPHMTIHA